jgi:hypothetical protein
VPNDLPTLRPAVRRPTPASPQEQEGLETPVETPETPGSEEDQSAALLHRLFELDAAVSEPPPTTPPAKKAAAKKAAAKKAPAKKAPAKKAAAKKAPATKAPATPRVAVPALAPAVAPPPPPVPRSVDVLPSRDLRLLWSAFIRLTVLLLAGALGLGAAALVESGAKTWRSTMIVQLVPGPSPNSPVADELKSAQSLYVGKVPELTTDAALSAGVASEDVRQDLTAQPVGTDRIKLTAEAAYRDEAERLAGAAGTVLAAKVSTDQQESAVGAGDRMTLDIPAPATKAERIKPSDVLAVVAGGLLALSLLVLALTVALQRRASRD